jgi:uncharacterized paraquat-inducible protein A
MNTSPSIHSWVNVAAYDQVTAAKALQGFLEKEGFEVRIHDGRGLQRYWFWTTPHAGILVQAPGPSYKKVRECLEADPGAQAFLQKAIRCPSCNSPRVQYPQMTHKFILPTLVAQLMVLLRLMKPECYCEDCHYTWVISSPSLPALPRPAKIR